MQTQLQQFKTTQTNSNPQYRATIPLNPIQAYDTALFTEKEPINGKPSVSFAAKAWSIMKKYALPYFMVAGGGFIAIAGVPFHILPVLGTGVGLLVNIVGGAVALAGLYWGYKQYKRTGY